MAVVDAVSASSFLITTARSRSGDSSRSSLETERATSRCQDRTRCASFAVAWVVNSFSSLSSRRESLSRSSRRRWVSLIEPRVEPRVESPLDPRRGRGLS